jgi:hypothetical protein
MASVNSLLTSFRAKRAAVVTMAVTMEAKTSERRKIIANEFEF